MRFVPIGVPAALLLATLAAQAQEFPRWEAFGGFSYANIDLGSQTGAFSPTSRNYYGFDLAFSFNPHRNIRLLLDTSVQLGETTATPPPGFTDVFLNTGQALFGPQFTFRRRRATAFANALVGVNATVLKAHSGGLVIDVVRQTHLALGLGGGVDVNLTRLVVIRAFQAQYVPTHSSGHWYPQYVISTGVVFRFGFH